MSETRRGGVFGLLVGDSVLITGIEDDPEKPDLLRVYIGHRSDWRYVLVSDSAEQDKVRRAWGSGQHIAMARPDHYYVDEGALAAMKERWRAGPFGDEVSA